MGRQPRVYIEGVLYYVTSRSGHVSNLFLTPEDYRDYISLVSKYKAQYGFKLFSYVLMPDKLHMLVELKSDTVLSSIMHDINSLYTKSYNVKYGKKGHLFEARFKEVLAEKETYLLPLIRQIHLCPKTAGVSDDPRGYPYSSHPQYMNSAKRQYPDMVREIEEVFKVLKGQEPEFEAYITGGPKKDVDYMNELISDKRILGSEAFAERIRKAIEENAKRSRARPISRRTRILYMLLGGATMLVVTAIVTASFYKDTVTLRSRYYKTLSLYETTLGTLKQEQSNALKENKAVEDYEWKIRLTEKELEKLTKEKDLRLDEERRLDGYSWQIEVVQAGGPEEAFNHEDTITFSDNQVSSFSLAKEGFSPSNYAKRIAKDGTVIWETIQYNQKNDISNWRGEWDGSRMKGVLRKSSSAGVVRDFSFNSKGGRIKQ